MGSSFFGLIVYMKFKRGPWLVKNKKILEEENWIVHMEGRIKLTAIMQPTDSSR